MLYQIQKIFTQFVDPSLCSQSKTAFVIRPCTDLVVICESQPGESQGQKGCTYFKHPDTLCIIMCSLQTTYIKYNAEDVIMSQETACSHNQVKHLSFEIDFKISISKTLSESRHGQLSLRIRGSRVFISHVSLILNSYKVFLGFTGPQTKLKMLWCFSFGEYAQVEEPRIVSNEGNPFSVQGYPYPVQGRDLGPETGVPPSPCENITFLRTSCVDGKKMATKGSRVHLIEFSLKQIIQPECSRIVFVHYTIGSVVDLNVFLKIW